MYSLYPLCVVLVYGEMICVDEGPWRALKMFHVHGHGACGALEILAKSVDAEHVVDVLVEPYDALVVGHVLGHSCWGALESLENRVDDDHLVDALV